MENNFEKNVQKKLEKLRVEPSQSVWTYIERRLQKRKIRKVVIWWFAFPALFLLLVGIYYYEQRHSAGDFSRPDSVSFEGQTSHSGITKIPKSTSAEKTGGEENDLVKENNKISPGGRITLNSTPLSSGVQPDLKKTLSFLSDRGMGVETTLFREKDKKLPVPATRIPIRGFIHEDFPSSTSQISPVTKKPELTSNKLALPDETRKSGWKFGLVFIAGGGYLSHHERIYSSPLYSAPYFDPNLSSGIPQQNITLTPSLSGSFSFKAGIKAQKSFHNRTGLSGGLLYRQSTVRQKITYISAAGRDIAEKYYDNNFRFIEVPIGFNLNNKIGGMDTRWEIGVSLSQLLNANALKHLNDRYYKDNSVFRSAQFGVHGGISVSIIKSPSLFVEVGPYYQYDLSGLSKTGVFGNQHFNFAGIKAEILLESKK